MLIDELIEADGRVSRTYLDVSGAVATLRDDDATLGALPVLAIERVVMKFGRELDPDNDVPGGVVLPLGPASQVRHFRFHAIVDTEARDYLVLERHGEPPLAALATTVAAALRHLLAAAKRART